MLSSNILNILFIRLTFKTENSRSWKDENTNLRQYEQRSTDRRDNDDDSPTTPIKTVLPRTFSSNPLHNDLLVTVQINIPNDKQ
jgi:hypothetical protein